MVQKVAVRCEFEAGLRHGRLENSANPAVNGCLFRIRKDEAAKGEGCARPFISCAQDTVGL